MNRLWLAAIFVVILESHAADVLVAPITHVRDADTIVVGDTPVRLQGIAAPEHLHEEWEAGKAFVSQWIGQTVACALQAKGSYDRRVGICALGRHDLARLIVAAGHARDCPAFSGGRYAKAEEESGKDWSHYPLPRYC